MATDIARVINSGQEVVDDAVAALTATRQTQSLLEYHITVTDTKIARHNVDEEAHEDIRLRLEDMPSLLTDPIISGPSAVETNTSGTWTFTSNGVIPTVTAHHFIVTTSEGETFTVDADSEGVGTFTHTFTGERNSTLTLSVQAVGGYASAPTTYRSAIVTKDILITHHLPPDMTNMTHTLPGRVAHGQSYNFQIGGIVDLDNDFTTFDLSCDSSLASFSQSSGCALNTTYTLTMANAATGPGNFIITVTAHDSYGLSNSKTITIPLNADPDVSAISHTIPYYLNANSSNTCRVAGVTDANGDTVTFSIASNNSHITFSKSSGIHLNEDFTIYVSDQAVAAETYTLTLTFVDAYTGSTTHTITSSVNVPPVMTNYAATKDYRYKIGDTGHVSFAGASDTEGEALLYAITNVPTGVVFSKTSGIAANEVIDVTVANTPSLRGTTPSFTVTVTDASGGVSSTLESITINSLPDLTNVTASIPATVAPDTTYELSFSGATDVDSNQTLTYTITSEIATITGGTNIAAGATCSMHTPTTTQVARGNSFTVTVTVSDGQESASTTLTFYQNILPDMSGLTTTSNPGRWVAGQTATVSFTGATDAVQTGLAQTLKYSISNVSTGITFAKTSNIDPNEAVGVTIDSSLADGTTVSFTVTATDVLGESSSSVESMILDNKPIASYIAITQSKERYPVNSVGTLSISGATDADGDTYTYSLSNIPAGISFTKTSAIAEDEAIGITIADTVTPGATLPMTVTVTDINGGSNSKSVNLLINTPPAFPAFTGTCPARVIPGGQYTITFGGASDVENNAIVYSISGPASVSFSKSSNIAPDESVTMTVSSEATRGATLTLTIGATDSNGDTTTATTTTLVNVLPVVSNLSCTLPAIVKPNTAYTPQISGATDANGDTLTYTITSEKATVTNAAGIAANTTFNVTTPTVSNVARGSTWTLDVVVSDGYESVSTSLTFQQNRLPVTTNLSNTLVATTYGGTANAKTFTLSGAIEPDSQAITYSITCADANASFSKTTNISANESLTFSYPKVAADTAVSYSVSAVDALGESSTKSYSITVNAIHITGKPAITSPTADQTVEYYNGFTMTWGAYFDDVELD